MKKKVLVLSTMIVSSLAQAADFDPMQMPGLQQQDPTQVFNASNYEVVQPVKLSREEELKIKLMVEAPYEAGRGQLFDEQAYLQGRTALNGFVNVIVINKAAKGGTAQTLRLYTNRQLMMTTKVSTGREDLEYVTPIAGFFRKFGKGSQTSHWRHTTRGFYTVKRIEGANYKSNESSFHMPYAMFFNADKGLAVHQVPPDLSGGERAGEAMLGSRASSGCVRVHKDYIQYIHSLVTSAGKGEIPSISTRTGLQEVDQYGQPKYEVGFRTIVIVEEY